MRMNRELVLVILGLVGFAIHLVDETVAFGAPSGPPWAVQIVLDVLLIALAALHPRLGPWRLVPGAVFALLGAFVAGSAWMVHVQPLLAGRPGPADATGVLAVAGGVLLFASGALLVQRSLTAGRGVPRSV